jgi:hypothetical protein
MHDPTSCNIDNPSTHSDTILPEIKQVENGWISAIGYQLNGYALVADF